MTTLLLARHGETDWNRELRIQGSSDIELNDLGRAQAHALAQELEHVDLDAIYASDLSRARATAEAVAASHGLEVRLDPRLRERSFGNWEGLTREDIAELPEGSRHDGESDDEVRERVVEAVQAIADAHPGEHGARRLPRRRPEHALAPRARRASGALGELRGLQAGACGTADTWQ